jgi:hypothetical protein
MIERKSPLSPPPPDLPPPPTHTAASGRTRKGHAKKVTVRIETAVLLRLNHGQNQKQSESESVLVAKARGGLRAEAAAVVMVEMATRAGIGFTKCSEMGVSCTSPLATGLMMTTKGPCSII